ncbi:hypothetical protein Aab01nite_21560 [Paractinoplanes abujensis]|uniref:Uncharacterized protein n=1 Tax=Paractinoplanes abujensis TaxID=882441 RepID=A0A7W7CYF3_9ACTN|nr:hypothetical protein [Actinoplanes abujensis]GID18566.1 hypothetical protein Aab01nite_21560 [Actinoplanes abujensis]
MDNARLTDRMSAVVENEPVRPGTPHFRANVGPHSFLGGVRIVTILSRRGPSFARQSEKLC